MNKDAIIENGTYNNFKTFRKALFKSKKDVLNKEYYKYSFEENEIDLCFQIYNAEYCRRRRTLDEIIRWCYAIENSKYFEKSKVVFISLTFTNEVLEKTKKQTRRRYVSRFLKENCFHYIGNIDFGEENDREHYHALTLINADISKDKWKYGVWWIKKINIRKNDIKKTSKYVLKLNNHSYKESTKQESLIYDKQPMKIIDILIAQDEESFRRFKIKMKDYMFGLD